MSGMTKDALLQVRIDEVDRARLKALAEHYELSVGGVIRFLAKREAEKLGLATKKKSKR
jgi:antitoxin component of RelBE/YafQ-DinJ toxin-antitoxin module